MKRDFNRGDLDAKAADDAEVQARANERTQRYLDNGHVYASDATPCPKCFAYDADAVNRLRREKFAWTLVVVGPSVFCSCLALGIGGAPHMLGPMTPTILVSWGVTTMLFIGREALKKTYDPNSDALLAARQRVLSNKKTILREDESESLHRG